MIERDRICGFDVAEAMEPRPPFTVQVDAVVRAAEFLEPTAAASTTEVVRAASEVLEVAHHDQHILREAQQTVRRRLAAGHCTRGAALILSTARRRDVDCRRQRIQISRDERRVCLKVTGPLTGDFGELVVQAVDSAADTALAVALELSGVHEWTAQGLASLERCVRRGADLDGAPLDP